MDFWVLIYFPIPKLHLGSTENFRTVLTLTEHFKG